MENRSTLVLGVRQRGKAAESTAFGVDRGRERQKAGDAVQSRLTTETVSPTWAKGA